MVDVAQLGYEVETSQVLKGEQALDELTESTLNADAASKKLAKSSGTAGAAVGGMAARTANLNKASLLASGGLRNVSLQLSQVAQQASATGDPIRALAIQLPDIGLAFGTVGIAAGVAAGALLPMITNLWGVSDASEAADNALGNTEKAIGNLRNDMTRLTELQDDYASAVVAGQDRIASSLLGEIKLRGDLIRFQRLELEQQQLNLQESLKDSEAAFDAVIEKARNAAVLIERDVVNEQFVRTRYQSEAINAIQQVLDENRKTTLEYEKQQAEAALVATQIEQIDLLLESATGNAGNLADGLMQSAIEAANTASALERFGGVRPQQRPVDWLPGDGDTGGSRRSGGGGARSDRFEQDLNRLVQSLETERETLEREYAEREALLNDFRAREFLSEEAHKQSLLRLEEEYHDSLRQLGMNASNQRLQEVSGFFGAMEQLALNSGKGLAKAAAVFGGIEATINAYRAATQALADPSVPFYAKAAAYASVLATGLGAAKAIRSAGAKIGAAGGGGGGAEGVSAAPSQQDFTNIRLEFVGGDNPDIIQAIWEEMLGRAQASSREGVIIEVARA